ncbi:BTAD domain-containing putative transcriptional regulator [Allorhizocola rhizosphaerae]|uniref:BTAD domain-containing putative transcriptional regulator n=1 Tax=Allorhizocola rhizosphaerae TaxID=1872709 RepID=UPI001B8B6204
MSPDTPGLSCERTRGWAHPTSRCDGATWPAITRRAAGRRAEALSPYRDLARRLADGLGIDPCPEVRELYTAVLRATSASPW